MQRSTIVRGPFAHLSRGQQSARHLPTSTWAERDPRGDLILDRPGLWMLYTTDGFQRESTVYVHLDDDCRIFPKGALGRVWSVVSEPDAASGQDGSELGGAAAVADGPSSETPEQVEGSEN